MPDARITAIVLSYSRQKNLPAIIDSLRATGRVSEVIVWNNNPALTLTGDTHVHVINSSVNFRAYARYAAALLASNDSILFHDDDIALPPDTIGALFDELRVDAGRIYGIEGRNLDEGRYSKVRAVGEVDIVLGQLMLFSKQLLASVYGDILKLTPIERGDDIAFSLLTGVKHICRRARITQLGPQDEHSLWRHPEHFAKRQEMIDRVLALRS